MYIDIHVYTCIIYIHVYICNKYNKCISIQMASASTDSFHNVRTHFGIIMVSAILLRGQKWQIVRRAKIRFSTLLEERERCTGNLRIIQS